MLEQDTTGNIKGQVIKVVRQMRFNVGYDDNEEYKVEVI